MDDKLRYRAPRTPMSLIVAVDREGVIGADGHLPWRLPSDLKRFRELTLNKSVIMGRKTWESLPDRFRPLPQRHNIVMSRDANYQIGHHANGDENKVDVCRDMDDVLNSIARARSENRLNGNGDGNETTPVVIGGAEIFQLFQECIDKIYCTIVDVSIKAKLASGTGDATDGALVKWYLMNNINNGDAPEEWRCVDGEGDQFRHHDERDEYRTRHLVYERLRLNGVGAAS